MGVRLIATDRPGFGHSPYVAGRSVVDHGHDLVALADHLGLDEVPLITISGGLIHGLGAAWAHPDRFVRLTSYSGLYLGAKDLLDELEGLRRPLLRFAFDHPRFLAVVLRVLFTPNVVLAERAPALVLRAMRSTRPPGDQAVLDRPEVKALMVELPPEQFRSVAAVAEALGRQQLPPYPFELSEIRQPIEIWQGGRDDVHLPAMARRLDREVPHARLHLFDELATFDLDVHYPEMLTLAVGRT